MLITMRLKLSTGEFVYLNPNHVSSIETVDGQKDVCLVFMMNRYSYKIGMDADHLARYLNNLDDEPCRVSQRGN